MNSKNRIYKFILDQLNCAHCASLIEEALRNNTYFTSVQFTFATKTLIVETADEETIEKVQSVIQEVCDSIEEGVHVEVYTEALRMEMADDEEKWDKKTIAEILLGLIVLFLVGFTSIFKENIAFLITAFFYLILARTIFIKSWQNIKKGWFLDENFLMVIATLGAFALGDYAEGLGVTLFYRIGELFETRATNRSRKEIMNVIDMRPREVTLVEDGKTYIVSASDIKKGDILQVRAGERIPLDGVVIEGESRLDTSPVTGEPKPRKVSEGSDVLSGCINGEGLLKIRVEKPLSDSFVTKIMESVESASANKPKVDRFITRFAKYYTPVVIAITVATMIIPSVITGDWKTWVYTGLTFLVISCPCALVLSVPLSFFAGIGGGSKEGILFKGGLSMENMKNTAVVAMDKTGTLTKGDFSVTSIERKSPSMTDEELLQYCASVEQFSTHPIAKSILAKNLEFGLPLMETKDVKELAGQGVRALIDGKEVLCGKKTFIEDAGIPVVIENNTFGVTMVYVAVDGQFVGRIFISDTVKEDALASIQALKKAGYEVVMLTGDAKEAAEDVAKKLGITKVYAGLLPSDKLEVMQNLRKEYGITMFVGDGINDAPVLAGADVGGAMGSGADAAIEAADVVYMNSHVESIVKSLRLATKTMTIAWQNVIFAISIKVLVMLLGFAGYASLWLAIFADTGVMILCVMNAIRLLYPRKLGI